MKFAFVLALLLLGGALPAYAQENPQAYVGAEIIPVSGPTIPNGVIIVHKGKIVAVGPRAAVQIPANAQVNDAAGKVIMPGLVDTHSHIGGGAGGDASAPIQPEVRIMDSINARDTGLQRAQAGASPLSM